jgi:hypothetical protein
MSKPHATHIAYVLKKETRNSGRWMEIGTAYIKPDGTSGGHHINLDRLPLGGFGGHILLQPVGSRPADPMPEPDRPGEDEL